MIHRELQNPRTRREYMKNIYEVLRQKEREFERLKKELETLYTAASLLEEELSVEASPPPVWTDPPMQAKPVAAVPETEAVWLGHDARHDANLIPQPASTPAVGAPTITGVVESRLDLGAVVRDVLNTCT
jgi:hypothetical protein